MESAKKSFNIQHLTFNIPRFKEKGLLSEAPFPGNHQRVSDPVSHARLHSSAREEDWKHARAAVEAVALKKSCFSAAAPVRRCAARCRGAAAARRRSERRRCGR